MPRVNDLLSSSISAAIRNQITWSIFYNVKEEGAVGNGAIDDYPVINNLINNKIEGNALVIFPKGEYLIRSNMTVPPNVFLYFVGEGLLKPDAGVTITINGGIIAGPYPILVGDGNADGSAPIADRIYPQWWGAKGDGVHDDTTAIVKARGMAPVGSTIWFLSGTYLVTDETLTEAPSNIYYIGEGQASNFEYNGAEYPIPAYGVLSSVEPNRAVVSDGSGALTTSEVTAAELGYLAGLTHNVQSHITDADIHVTADDKLSWNSKAPGSTAAALVEHIENMVAHLTQAEHEKLTGIQAGAEVNQNAFSKIAVAGQGDVNAGSKSATLTFKNGTGITFTTNPITGEVMITATGQATPGPHALSHITGGTDIIPDAVPNGDSGLMSGVDKAALDQAVQDIDTMAGEITDLQTVVGEHTAQLADLAYQTAGGTATAIALTLPALTNGYSKTFIASANNNGAATTINGKPLYKPNTTSAPTLIAGKAYTVWYNLSGDRFFIKASAEGTATTAQVLAGVPFSNETDTGLIGTMPNRAGDTPAINSEISGTTLKVLPSAGYRDGVDDWVTFNDPDFIAANILTGKNIFGLVGTLVVPKKANGQATSGSSSTLLYTTGGAQDNAYLLTVTGLDFTPRMVFIVHPTQPHRVSTCNTDAPLVSGYRQVFSQTAGGGFDSFRLTNPLNMVSGGFTLAVGMSNTLYNWYAFE